MKKGLLSWALVPALYLGVMLGFTAWGCVNPDGLRPPQPSIPSTPIPSGGVEPEKHEHVDPDYYQPWEFVLTQLNLEKHDGSKGTTS